MHVNPLWLLFLLVLIIVGFFWVSRISRTRKELQKRLLHVVPAAGGQLLRREVEAGPRVRPANESRFDTVERLLNVPQDVPLANVLAPPLVIMVGLAGGFLFYLLAGQLLSRPLSVVIGLVTAVLMVRGIFAWEITRYQNKLVNQLPDTVQLVVSATRAGLPVSEAFRAVADEMSSPTHEEFIRVVNEIALGTTPDAALLAMHHRTGVTEYAIFAVTIGVQSRSGGRLAETIQNLAEIVRERLVITARAKALSGEAKASGIIMAILPFVAGGIQYVTNPDQMSLLFNDPRCTRLLAIGSVTFILGVLTMNHLISGATKD